MNPCCIFNYVFNLIVILGGMCNLFDKFMHPIVDFIRDELNQEMLGKVFCEKGLVLYTFIHGSLDDFFDGSV